MDQPTQELNLFKDIEKYPWLFALGAPIVGCVLELWIWWGLFRIPEGTAIRPMLQSMQAMVVDVGSVLIGGVGSLHLVVREKKRAAGWMCGILSFAPFIVGILFVRWILFSRHLRMAP